MAFISSLTILNYRSCQQVSIHLRPFTPIVGYNNAGKSNVLSAIQWLLNPERLDLKDFWDAASPIVVQATVDDIHHTNLQALGAAHRNRIEPFVRNGRLVFRRTAPEPGSTVAKCPIELRDPEVSEEGDSQAWKANPSGIWPAIQALFPAPIRIGAMEDSAEDAAKYKTTTTLGLLVAEISEPLVTQFETEFADSLRGITDRLHAEGQARPELLRELDSQTTAATADFFPGIEVRLHVPTPQGERIKTRSISITCGFVATVSFGRDPFRM